MGTWVAWVPVGGCVKALVPLDVCEGWSQCAAFPRSQEWPRSGAGGAGAGCAAGAEAVVLVVLAAPLAARCEPDVPRELASEPLVSTSLADVVSPLRSASPISAR